MSTALRRPSQEEINDAKDYWHAQITTNDDFHDLGDWSFRQDLFANEFTRNSFTDNEPTAAEFQQWLYYVSLDQLKGVIDELVTMLTNGTHHDRFSLSFGPDTGTDHTAVPDVAANAQGKNGRGYVFRRINTISGRDLYDGLEHPIIHAKF